MVEVSLIGASVFALVIIAIPTLKGIWYTYDVPEAEKANAYEVTATGYQWWFKFDYPNENGADARPDGQAGQRRPLDRQRARDPRRAARSTSTCAPSTSSTASGSPSSRARWT